MNPLSKILTDPNSFLKNIFHALEKININVTNYELDHICYRTKNIAQYYFLKKELNNIGELLTESKINGRPIATYKLHQPIILKHNRFCALRAGSPLLGLGAGGGKCTKPIMVQYIYKNREIYLLELPSPKKGSHYPAGFEHVEFVINTSLEKFIAAHPNIDFDKKGMSKKTNPDVRVKFAGFSVKFHLHNLEYVIRYLD
ncbi:MAG TPA: hypothetical protein ENJ95_03085 [Bacteroidetes bacterium]|nr:hypothetical protein [Bacteroidota bacterium]